MAPLSQHPQPASPESKSARRGVLEAPDFQRLLDETNQDVDAMLQTTTLASTEILDTSVPLDDRIRRFGTLIGCTLLAHEHRGGYLVRTNTQQLLGHLEEDFGIRGAEIATAFGLPSFDQFLKSQGLANYVQFTFNQEQHPVLKGVPFQNEFLSELLVQQEEGKIKLDKKELDKKLDRAARLQANKMTPESIDARIRIYTCMQAVGAEHKLRPYGDVQAEYLRVHQKMLNKAELKSAFGIGEPTNVFRECCFADVHVQEDAYKTGLFHVQLKRPLNEIIEEYEKVKEEVANSTLPCDLKKLQQYNYHYYNRGRERPEKKKSDRKTPELAAHVDVVPEYLKPSIAPESQASGQSTSKSAPSLPTAGGSKKPSKTTARGEGTFSDEDDDEDAEFHPPPSLAPAKAASPLKTIAEEPKMLKVQRRPPSESSDSEEDVAPKKAPQKEPPRLAPAKRQQRSEAAAIPARQEVRQPEPQSSPSHVQEVRARTKSPPPPISQETAALIHAYVTGFLSSLFPALYTPTKSLMFKTKAYLQKRGIEVSTSQLKPFFLQDLAAELAYRADYTFVGLAGSK